MRIDGCNGNAACGGFCTTQAEHDAAVAWSAYWDSLTADEKADEWRMMAELSRDIEPSDEETMKRNIDKFLHGDGP